MRNPVAQRREDTRQGDKHRFERSGACPRAYFRVPLLILLVVAIVACSSRPSRDAGRLALQLPIADPVLKVGASEASDAPLERDIAFLENATKKLLEGSIIKASNGTPLYTPDGKAHYAALWTRDFASMIENAGDLMPQENIEKCIDYLVKGIREDGAVPDRVQMESLLYWRASKMLARWEKLFGSGEGSEAWAARARAIEKNIDSLRDEKTGMFFAASRDCRQTDIWANAYAVYIDFPLGDKKDRIIDWLVSNFDRYVWKGQVRHLPKGEYWERQLVPVVKERYQNGAYWATPAGWVIWTLNGRDPALARQMFIDLIDNFRTSGICECINIGYRQLDSYVNSATNPLAAARKIWSNSKKRPSPYLVISRSDI